MAERALRGARLGAQSFEDERGVEMAPRQDVEYITEGGEKFTVTMSTEAEIPLEWEHPKTGIVGRLADAGEQTESTEKPVRSHWDMLLERRSREELEEILSERLELLRAGEIGPVHLHRRGKTSRAKKSQV